MPLGKHICISWKDSSFWSFFSFFVKYTRKNVGKTIFRDFSNTIQTVSKHACMRHCEVLHKEIFHSNTLSPSLSLSLGYIMITIIVKIIVPRIWSAFYFWKLWLSWEKIHTKQSHTSVGTSFKIPGCSNIWLSSISSQSNIKDELFCFIDGLINDSKWFWSSSKYFSVVTFISFDDRANFKKILNNLKKNMN